MRRSYPVWFRLGRVRDVGGLLPRPIRNPGGRRHRRTAGVSAAGPRARHHHLSRSVGAQHHDHPRRPQHSRTHPSCAGGDVDIRRARVRHRSAGARRQPRPHTDARVAAEHRAPANRFFPARCRGDHRRRGRVELFGSRRAAACAELGRHDRRGPRQPRYRSFDRVLAGQHNVSDRAGVQHGRRSAPRADRSPAGGVVTGPALLVVEQLSVDLPTPRGRLRAVDEVDLELAAGHTLGIVGESGCGKTMLSRAILQLAPRRARLSGRVLFDGRDLTRLDAEALRSLRGRSIAVVFQDPMTSLNPVLTIGRQLSETMREHLAIDGSAAARRAVELLAEAGIPAPEQRLRQYPHQLSGGMRQRVAIAIALSCEPRLLIADEPTTALDVTVQAQILDLLAREQQRRHMAMILITHDLGVVAGRTDEVAVMYAGRVVERAPTPVLFKKMHMPYTEALLAAIPKLEAAPHTPLPAISGRPPDPTRPTKGCSFAPRCRYSSNRCHSEKPRLVQAEARDHRYACFHPIKLAADVDA